jgi:glycosyltransferase involved in cell wall biosynthesis
VKAVYLNPTGVLGGAEMCLLDLLASFLQDGAGSAGRQQGWSPLVLLGDDGPLRGAVADLGVPCDVVPLPPRLARVGDAGVGPGGRWQLAAGLAARGPAASASAAAYLARLRRRLRAEAPDLLQTNGMKAHLLGTWAVPRGVPVVWHLHDYLGARAAMSRLLRWSARARRGVRGVAVSRSVAADAGRELGPRVPVEVVYNAVDLARFAPGTGDGAWLDAQAGLPPADAGTVRVGLVATYARWKGHEVFLEAVARIAPGVPARFFVVGGPIYRTGGSQHDPVALRERAAALGLAGRVGFVGHQDDPAAVFRALDVVVHASTRPEPFGRVIVEAMACGRAVVVARAGGAAELFDDGVSALGCPPSDPAALAAAVTRLAGDGGLRRALGEAARRSVTGRFDRARLAGEWRAIYDAARSHEPQSHGKRQHGVNGR